MCCGVFWRAAARGRWLKRCVEEEALTSSLASSLLALTPTINFFIANTSHRQPAAAVLALAPAAPPAEAGLVGALLLPLVPPLLFAPCYPHHPWPHVRRDRHVTAPATICTTPCPGRYPAHIHGGVPCPLLPHPRSMATRTGRHRPLAPRSPRDACLHARGHQGHH